MKSMTGYGRAKSIWENKEITIEMRAVNHRYFDCTVKVPRAYLFLEEVVKKQVGRQVSRGKMDVFVGIRNLQELPRQVMLQEKLAQQYVLALQNLGKSLGLKPELTVQEVAMLPDVLMLETIEEDAETLTEKVLAVTQEALFAFDHMRTEEGARLAQEMQKQLYQLERMTQQAEERSPQSLQEYRQKLEKRMQEVLADVSVDPQRVLTEVAIFADKTAINEETVRLKSHITHFQDMMDAHVPIGRKLDFLLQEMNRETNTIGSKANDLTLANLVIDMKAEIEKIREQAQNIE